jgi:hypothetical protein
MFYAVYKKNKLISLSTTAYEAKSMAMTLSSYRWTSQNFDKDWKYLLKDGKILTN